MKVLVTGGSGFLGQAIASALLARGDEVRVFCRSDYPDLRTRGIEIFRGDIKNSDDVQKATIGMEAVIHTAAKIGVWGRYDDFYNTNVLGTQHVIDACRKQKIRYFVYTSTPSVVFDGKDIKGGNESLPYAKNYLSFYPKTKALAEQRVLLANTEALKTVALRPHLIWGPGDNQLIPRLIDRAKKGKLVLVRGENHLVDTIYVENAAYAHLLALDCLIKKGSCGGKVYFISQDQPVNLNAFINQILSAANLPAAKRYISPRFAYLLGAWLETLYKCFHIKKEPSITRFVAQQLSSSHWFDISNAKRDLGYEPKISIQQGLDNLKVWFKKEGISHV